MGRTRCVGCKEPRQTRRGLFGTIDGVVNEALGLAACSSLSFSRLILDESRYHSIEYNNNLCYTTFANEETVNALCPELKPASIASMERNPEGVRGVISELRRCGRCQVFDPSRFRSNLDWADVRFPGCDCHGDDTGCMPAAFHIRLHPNGDSSEINGADRRSNEPDFPSNRIFQHWKNARLSLLATFVVNAITFEEQCVEESEFEYFRQTAVARTPAPRENDAGATPPVPLRFNVGDDVMCHIRGVWAPGKIVRQRYRGRCWPSGAELPYQVKLSNAQEGEDLIYVPEDTDEFCQRAQRRCSAAGSKGGDSGSREETARAAGSSDIDGLRPGAACMVHGLRSASVHNGKAGKLLEFDVEKHRWGLKLYDGERLFIKPANLKPLPKSRRALVVQDCGTGFAADGIMHTIAKRVGGCSLVKMKDLEQNLSKDNVGAVIFPEYGTEDQRQTGAPTFESATARALRRFVESGGSVIFMGDGFCDNMAPGAGILEHTFERSWKLSGCGTAIFRSARGSSEFISKKHRHGTLHLHSALMRYVPEAEMLYACDAARDVEEYSPNRQASEGLATAAAARIGEGLVAYLGDVNFDLKTLDLAADLAARAGCNGVGSDPLPELREARCPDCNCFCNQWGVNFGD
mmetsp:Transcript_39726/g.62025  ORF Transcript_39726/g.62025 Transcript_39726/m.62025 type:complete len:635 (+) Transcript_39726:169-2073(+)